MPSITLYFKHFACQYFISRNENAKKTETAHRQKLFTYRKTPCKVTKIYTKQKKDIFQKDAREKRITKSKKPLYKLSKKKLLSVL
jgi:hypothetical protein